MNKENEDIPVTRICDRFAKSTVAYYKGRKTRARLANKEDFILLLVRRERMVNPMAGCEKVLYAIRPAMAEEGVAMGVNRFYRLMKANGMMVPKRRKYSCTTTKQDKSLVPSPNLVKGMEINEPDQALCSDIRPCYQKALAILTPMQIGSGTCLKVLECLRMGRPLISTQQGLRGIRPEYRNPENGILPFEDLPSLVSVLEHLLSADRVALQNNAVRFVQMRNSQEFIDAALKKDIESVVKS